MAISANINVRAFPSIKIFCFVLHAGRIRNTSVVSVIVDASWVTTIARSTSKAVNHSLGVQINRSGIVVFQKDIESISKS